MTFLQELLQLNERVGALDRHADDTWRQDVQQQAAGENQEHWLVTPQGKKHGPFGSKQMAQAFLQKRTDIPPNSKLHSVRKGSTI